MKRTEWFKRSFPVIEDNGVLPSLIERLSGTPARLEELVGQLPPDLLTVKSREVKSKEVKSKEKWTIKEEIGHLSDMEPLWLGRLDDLINGLAELRVADLTNQTTHTAGHDATEITLLLQRFRDHRRRLLNRLYNLSDPQLANSSLHPRLKTPMRIADLAYFVAEHDDHHLAGIREISGILF